jgi:hypothetical protein
MAARDAGVAAARRRSGRRTLKAILVVNGAAYVRKRVMRRLIYMCGDYRDAWVLI